MHFMPNYLDCPVAIMDEVRERKDKLSSRRESNASLWIREGHPPPYPHRNTNLQVNLECSGYVLPLKSCLVLELMATLLLCVRVYTKCSYSAFKVFTGVIGYQVMGSV